ncbi:MAG TPA: heptaprenyl diphosphate synthase component 1 [Bacillales bacterium]|nr:heptaprenyl diphosphate synthase component 1 [Bacillales bacterium]
MKDIYDEIKQIKADIDERAKHPYLIKFIDVPVIDEQKVLLLYCILSESKISSDKIKQLIIATMLIQMALDTHELVGINRIEEDHPYMKQRQLTVLGGDYYSGLYYYLLALIDDIPMLQALSIAIKEINEYKVAVYQRDQNNIGDFIESVAMIESLLVQKIAQYVGNKDMVELSKQLLLINKLNNEKSSYLSGGYSAFFDGIYTIQERTRGLSKNIARKQALILVDNQIITSIHYIESFLQNHSGTYRFLCEKIRSFITNIDIVMEKAVKEG